MPELQKRTISTEGTRSITICPSTFSSSQGAPKEVPLSICALSFSFTRSFAWPQMAGPQEPT